MKKEEQKKLKVLYLFNGSRGEALKKIHAGENPGDGFWGMLRLPHYGIQAEYVELEQFFSKRVSDLVRRYIPVYFIHLPLFFKFFSYDIVFTSSAFGSQFLHTLLTLCGLKRPLWVMHDFSITGMIGKKKTVRQRIFHWMTKHAAGIVTIGNEEKRRLLQMFPEFNGRIEWIPFGVDTSFFSPQKEKKLQVFSSGYDPDRDWSTLIRACEGLGVPVVISTRRKRLERLEPLPDFVQVRDLSLRELAREYASSAVVVLPLDTSSGLNDAMGCTTLIEAMTSGSAVVATHTHTTASYIQNNENGILVSQGGVQAMRSAIQRVLDDSELRAKLGNNARTYALENLDAEKCTERLSIFLRRLVR